MTDVKELWEVTKNSQRVPPIFPYIIVGGGECLVG